MIKWERLPNASSPSCTQNEFNLRSKLVGLQFNRIFKASTQSLEAVFTKEEVSDCLKIWDGNKAPGSNGFTMKFLQEFWYLIKDDVIELFSESHNSGNFVKSLNATFLSLIPRKKGAKEFNDLRPISLVGSIYKLIIKVLAKKLSRILGEVIGDCQHAFVEGHQILEIVMAANEVADDLISGKKKWFIL